MAVGFSNTNKPINPRGEDASALGYNRAALYSGKALYFDAVNDYVESAEQITGLTTGLTFLGHVYIDSLSAGKNRIFTQWDGLKGWFLVTNGTDKNAFFRTNTSNGSVDIITDTAPFKVGEWMHIACTYDGAQMAFYIDGQLIDTAAQTGNLTTPTSQKFRVGINESLIQPFDGKITGTKVFDVALTQSQILDLYNNPEKVVPTGVSDSALKLWLPMQEGAGTTAYDGSGNGNHGTISGATYTHGIGAPVSQTAVIDWNKGTNLLKYSEDFTQSNWPTSNVTITANDAIAPDGQTTAEKITEVANTNYHLLGHDPLTTTANVPYTFSVFVKAGTNDFGTILINSSGSQEYATIVFDLTSGTITKQQSGSSATINNTTITSAGNDWYLVSLTATINNTILYPYVGLSNSATPTISSYGIVNYLGSTANHIYAWGASMISGSSVGPYIPTLATAQTTPVLLPQGLTSGRDITGVNLFENVRKQGALNLDGNSWAEVHDNASLDVSPAMTMEAWVKCGDELDSIYNHIFVKQSSDSSWESPYGRYVLRLRETSVQWWFDSVTTATTYSVSLSGWNHLAVTKNGTSEILYLNGVQVDTHTGASSITASDYSLLIGSRTGHSAAEMIDNQLAQPRIYNRALTAAEVLQNYNSGKNTYK